MSAKLSNILIIYTGGTLGMKAHDEVSFDSHQFEKELLSYLPEARQLANLSIVSPFMMDSSNFSVNDWITIGQLIETKMNDYDGFVVIHGTDTMCYTACALSFMLQNVPKSVVLTGSQRPLTQIRNDARMNLINAIEMACMPLSEVAICFDDKLLRGNRSKKMSINDFDAFDSPNYPALAKLGLHVDFVMANFKRNAPFLTHYTFDSRVVSLKITPSFPICVLESILKTDTQIILLEAYGGGHLPIQNSEIVSFIERATGLGRLVLVASQCIHGRVDMNKYECGRKASEAGAISILDMTVECALVKAMYLLGYYGGSVAKVRENYHLPLAGELTHL